MNKIVYAKAADIEGCRLKKPQQENCCGKKVVDYQFTNKGNFYSLYA